MKRYILLLFIGISLTCAYGQRVTGAVVDDVTVVKKNPTGFLVLKVHPQFATAYVDNIKLNGSDEVKLDVGTHTLYVEAQGYIAHEQEFTIEKNKTCTIEVNLSNMAQATIITNVPASRKIDGIIHTQETTATYELVIGKHSVELSAEGYLPLEKTFEVKQGGKNTFTYKLQEAPKKPESDHMDVTIETNVPCHRTVDNIEYEMAQTKTYPMTWGEHSLSLNAEGYFPVNTKVNVKFQGQNLFHYDLVKKTTGMRGKHEIGLVVGGLNGASYKYWFTDNVTLHADLAVGFLVSKIGYACPNCSTYHVLWIENIFDFTINPNAEYNFALPYNFYLYAGGGISLGYVGNLESLYDSYAKTYINAHMGKFGINAVAGVEYVFNQKPFSIALDFRPGYGLAFAKNVDCSYFDWKLAFSARYYF